MTRRLRHTDPGRQGRRGGGIGPAAMAVRPGLRRGDRPRRRHPDLVLAHHHQIIVQPGQVVGTGQVIGYEGTTGFSTGCHLHFATNVNGIWENPRYLLP